VRRDNPQTKDTHYLVTARRVYESLPSGIHEGLLLSEDGALLEGLSSNFFAVREGVLHTEPRRALHGITRALVLEAAGGLLPLATTAARIDQLPELSECFITSTSRGILPVVLIDDVHIGQGRPGEITRTLASRFDALVEREAEALFA
jgi:branched-chain amino acid aminotransferase